MGKGVQQIPHPAPTVLHHGHPMTLRPRLDIHDKDSYLLTPIVIDSKNDRVQLRIWFTPPYAFGHHALLIIAAARLPPRSEPANSQLESPSAAMTGFDYTRPTP